MTKKEFLEEIEALEINYKVPIVANRHLDGFVCRCQELWGDSDIAWHSGTFFEAEIYIPALKEVWRFNSAISAANALVAYHFRDIVPGEEN